MGNTNIGGEMDWVDALRAIDWPVKYGIIKVQIRDGNAVVVTIEKTIKLD